MIVRSSRTRAARVGDLLRIPELENGRGARRIDATALVIPGIGDLGQYVTELERHQEDFAAWDGRVVVIAPDGGVEHQVVVIDRYGQVYETTRARDLASLPGSRALEEWFRFLATACPECGVIDDPRARGWVP